MTDSKEGKTGRTTRSQRGGQRFDPAQVHQSFQTLAGFASDTHGSMAREEMSLRSDWFDSAVKDVVTLHIALKCFPLWNERARQVVFSSHCRNLLQRRRRDN